MYREQTPELQKLLGQLHELCEQFSILSKQKPHDPVNAFKLRFVNVLLEQANSELVDQYRPFRDFSLFDSESLPTNSDVLLILSQYIKCLTTQDNHDRYRSD
jgi:hypothetical protein